MKRCFAKGLLPIFGTMLLISGGLALPAVQDPDGEPLKLRADLVTLDAEVTRGKDRTAVANLTKEDFTLSEDGVPQQITNFSRDMVPLSVLLLLDVSGSVQPVISEVSSEGLKALEKFHPEDEVGVVAFGRWAMVTQELSKDRRRTVSRIADIEQIGPWIREATYIDEAVYQGALLMGKLPDSGRRKVMIVITDNINNQPEDEAHGEAETRRALSRSNAALCGLIVGDFPALVASYRSRGKLVRDTIGDYVKESGGLVSEIEKGDAVVRLGNLIEEMRTRYSFGYVPVNPVRDGKFHRITLSVRPAVEKIEGKVEIKTRKGYFAAN